MPDSPCKPFRLISSNACHQAAFHLQYSWSCAENRLYKPRVSRAGYDIGSTSVAVPLLENSAVNGISW